MLLATPSSVYAQENNAIVDGLLRAFVGTALKGVTKSQWDSIKEKVPPDFYYCVECGLAARNLSVQALIDQGVAPSDERIQPIAQSCDKFLARTLRKDFSCSLGSQQTTLATQCDEKYTIRQNGQLVEIDRDAAIKAYMQDSSFSITNTETQAAKEARRIASENEQRERNAERARIAEEQLHQQQIAQEAEMMRQKEAARIVAEQRASEKAAVDRLALEKAARENVVNAPSRTPPPEVETPKKSTIKARSTLDL